MKGTSAGTTKEDRIIELSRLGLEPGEVLAQMTKEGSDTTSGLIYKARSKARKKGEIFPKADKNRARTQAVLSGNAAPRRGKGSRNPRTLFEREVAGIAKGQSDLEYRAARNPGLVADYVLEMFPRLDGQRQLWAKFKRMALAKGSLRAAIGEAVGLVPPFREEVATRLANNTPPPKIQDYATSALAKWVQKFMAERRGSGLPPGRAGTNCGTCGNEVDVYKKESGPEFFCWCAKCRETRIWTCGLCESPMKIVKVGEAGYGPVCTGCGKTLVFDDQSRVHIAKSWDGQRLWGLLLGAAGLARAAGSWHLVEIAEKNSEIVDYPDFLYRHISVLLSPDSADRVVGRFFETEYVNPAELARRKAKAKEDEYEKWFERMLKIQLIESLS